MKAIGLAGAGLGAAAATTPVIHDLDELMSTNGANTPRPWWVKERDILDPSFEIDWTMIERRNRQTKVLPEAKWVRRTPEAEAQRIKWIKDSYPDWQGDSVRDTALANAASGNRPDQYGWDEVPDVDSPADGSFAPFSGTPEENLAVVRAGFRLLGANYVGVVPIEDGKTKKLINKSDSRNDDPLYTFTDAPWQIETEHERQIPNSFRSMINWTHVQAYEISLTSPSKLGQTGSNLAYARMPQIVPKLHEFLYGLGYGGVNGYSSALAPSAAFGSLSGMGEHGRMCFNMVTPDFGAVTRGNNRLLTNMNLAPTNPIEFGHMKFCETCKICAEEGCPYEALPLGDPSWEVDTKYQPPGFKGYRLLQENCLFCRACQSWCPFNTTGDAFIHDIVRGTVSTTSIFNSFFTSMEKTFGYGMKNPEDWWDIKDMPRDGVPAQMINRGSN
jgi:reductive dehalogenase